jgi:hypothetical protein
MKRFAGLLLLAAAIGVVIFYSRTHGKQPDTVTPGSTTTASAGTVVVKGLVGGEKTGFLDDEKVKKILADRYGLSVESSKRGSIEMVSGDVAGNDFLWPSSQFAAQLFLDHQAAGSQRVPKSETIFNSPIVFYSWNIVTDALTNQKII